MSKHSCVHQLLERCCDKGWLPCCRDTVQWLTPTCLAAAVCVPCSPSGVKLEAGGKTIFVNAAPVDTADLSAGKASLWLMGAPVLSEQYQSMLDSLQSSTTGAAAEPVPSTKSAKPAAVPADATKTAAKPAVAADPAADTVPVSDKAAAAVADKATPAAAPAAATPAAATPAAATPAAGTPPPKTSSAGSAGLAAAVLAVPALMALLA